MPEHGTAELGDLLISLTERLPAQQQRLDEDYLRRLDAAAPALRMLAERGGGALARAAAPFPMVLSRVEVALGVRLTRGEERQLAVRARPLNLGYVRKYAYSQTAASALRVVVERVPGPPRSDRPAGKESTLGE